MKIFHILNGDSLKGQFPTSILGEQIVARECLIDGTIEGESLDELFSNRAEYLESYSQVPNGEYFKTSVPQFINITNIPAKATIYCWFEEDLFCQANFWFVLHLLATHLTIVDIYLVRPNKGNEYSFGHMDTEALIKAFKQATLVSHEELNDLSKLWRFYQQKNHSEMLSIAKKYREKYNFLVPAILAEIDRIPDHSGYGRPERTLLTIIKELNTEEFSSVFRLFHQREGIYSFGDLQVRRMLDELLKTKSSP